MTIKLSKTQIQKQGISLTPLLKKSIDLLQLSRYELIKKIENEILDNPFLQKNELEGFKTQNIDEDFNFEIESKKTLRDHLFNQINDLRLDKKERDISEAIIDSLDESGKLQESIDEIENILDYRYFKKEIESVLLNTIQKLEPAGIGYRNHKECIYIQIINKNISKKQKEICKRILTNGRLDNIDLIIKDLKNDGFESLDIKKCMNLIKKCDLNPGLNFSETEFISPDLKLKIFDKKIDVGFNEKDFPNIKIDESLIRSIKKETKKHKNNLITEKINEAKWLVSSIKKRNDTIKKVGEIICSKQIAFFENNPLKINTLGNIDIARELKIHPSTVSRILRYKYIDTPKGLMTMKSLMVPSVSKTRKISAIQLMEVIKNTIEKEKKPKSDRKIAIELNKKGYSLARRTISKYRKKNNIPSSRFRQI